MDSDPLILQQIQDRACKLFFPKGKSHFGLLEDMSRVVTNFAGKVIYSYLPETSTGTSGIENFDNCADQDSVGCEDLGVGPKELQVIKIHRSRVCKDMLHYFQDETITTHSIVFEIIDDRGKPEKGAGIGVGS